MAMRPRPGTWTAWVAANAAGELVGPGTARARVGAVHGIFLVRRIVPAARR